MATRIDIDKGGTCLAAWLVLLGALAPLAAGAHAIEPGVLSQELLIEETPPPLPEQAKAQANAGGVEWAYSPVFGVYGPTFVSADGEHRLTVGLFVWFDNTFVTDDELAAPLGLDEIDGQSRLRTAKLELHGFYGENFFYYFRVDFQDAGSGSGDASMEWAALGILGVPVVQNLLIGLQMPVYGLDIWASYPRYRVMLEPSLVNAFFRGPLLGITAFGVEVEGGSGYSWVLGVARDTTEERIAGLQGIDIDRGSGDGVIDGRFSWFPRYREQGRHMLMVGVSGAFFKPDNDTISFGFYPEIFTTDPALLPFIIVPDVEESLLGVLELRWVEGPVSLQAEYYYNETRRAHSPDLSFDSYYVQAGWFVTGEQRVFAPSALFGRVLPAPHLDPEEGEYGALELQLRFSHLDLTDEEFQGGDVPNNSPLGALNARGAVVTNYTLGFNWFLNQHVKIGVNFVHSVREDLGDAAFDAIQARLAWTL